MYVSNLHITDSKPKKCFQSDSCLSNIQICYVSNLLSTISDACFQYTLFVSNIKWCFPTTMFSMYTVVWFLIHRGGSHVTPYACCRSFGPLNFHLKFMTTWLILFEYALLVHIKTRRMCSFGPVRIVLMDQNCKFEKFMITWLQITSDSQFWSIKTVPTGPKLHIRRVLMWTKSAYSKRSRGHKFRRESQWTKTATACIWRHVTASSMDQKSYPRVPNFISFQVIRVKM